MPLILKDFANKDCISGVWKFNENENELIQLCNLSDYDKSLIAKAKSTQRRIELLSTRALIKALGLDISIKYNGRKPICSKGFISISHSNSLVGIIWHPNLKTTIDLEDISNKILRISKRFCSTEELKFANNNIKLLNIIWNCKECIFKLLDKQGIEFKEEIKVNSFVHPGEIICEYIDGNSKIKFPLESLEFHNNTVVWGNASAD